MSLVRVETVFPSDDLFLRAVQAAIRGFAFRRRSLENGSFVLEVDGHTSGVPMVRKEWKPFKSKEWHLAPYEGPVVALSDFLIRTFGLKTIYDIGAARGFHSFMAATLDGHETVVHAFEIQPVRYSDIEAMANSKEVLGRLHAHLAGLSDRHEGVQTVWYNRRNLYESKPDPKKVRDAWHRRLKFFFLNRENKGTLREATVLITSVDKFVLDHNAPPDLIKLDVDGYEAKVIPGATETIAKRPFIIFELHKDELLARFGVKRKDVVAPLFDAGYRAAILTDHNDCTKCEVVKVGASDPSFQRQATTMYLFY